jgi:large subunit ribosomal protein L5e
MPFIKIVKTNAYSKRFQVKFRRRREGKTDYYARQRLVLQDKNKYNSPKYRLVVRFSNTEVTCQVAYATINHDEILCAAYSHELSRYGAPIYPKGHKRGFKNYPAAYATGLLVARRLLSLPKINLDKQYVGVEKADGAYFRVKKPEGPNRRPFKVLLDVGLTRTTTGHRVFGAMKGAVDGGLDIPHKPKRFPADKTAKGKFSPKTLRKYIYGGHVADYMKHLQESNPEKYKKHFASYIKAGKGPGDLEKMWAEVHANIRKNPARVKVENKEAKKYVKKNKAKKNLKQRKNRIAQKLASMSA